MKKIIACLLTFLMLATLAGCGAKEKAEEKLTEKVIEEAGGGDVDIDGDKVTIKGEDGEELVVGSTEWPTSDLAKSIPEFKEGKITAVLDSEDSILVTLESVKVEDATAYFETIKNEFTVEAFEVNSEGYISYGAQNEDGVGITLQYSEETFTITASKAVQ